MSSLALSLWLRVRRIASRATHILVMSFVSAEPGHRPRPDYEIHYSSAPSNGRFSRQNPDIERSTERHPSAAHSEFVISFLEELIRLTVRYRGFRKLRIVPGCFEIHREAANQGHGSTGRP